MPYMTPCVTLYITLYITPYMTLYNRPYITPYITPYMTLYMTPYTLHYIVHYKPLKHIILQEQQTVLKRKEYEEEELFTELGHVVYHESRLQDVYAGIGLPRCSKKVKLVMQEYEVVRERGLAVSQRLARHAERAALKPQQTERSTCGFCRVHLSTSQKR